jgi:hypothetical protein
MHQQPVVGWDDVGDIEAVQVVGAERGFPSDEQQSCVAGVSEVVVPPPNCPGGHGHTYRLNILSGAASSGCANG